MWQDVMKRPFITVGFTGFVLLIPLAITSTAGWIRTPRRKALADAAPADLRDRRVRRNSLLLVGEIGCSQTARICLPRRNMACVEDRLVAHGTTKAYCALRERPLVRNLVPQKQFSSREDLKMVIYSSLVACCCTRRPSAGACKAQFHSRCIGKLRRAADRAVAPDSPLLGFCR